MRVCIISREYPPDTGWGGIATFSKHLANGLKQLGHDVEVVALADGPSKLAYDGDIPVHRVAPYVVPGDLGIVSMCMPYSRTVLKCVSALWQKFIQLHQEKPFDVVDTPELLGEGIYPAITRCVPLVIRLYTPHSKFMAEQLHNITPTFDHHFVAMLERLAMLSADALTSPSEDLAEFVANDLGYDKRLISIIRNPIDCSAFTPDGDKVLPDSGNQRVLFVGRLEERKGITYLVQAIPTILQSCPNTEFVIIGPDTINAADGQHSVLNQLRDLLARHNALSSVRFITRVDLGQLPSYYRSADVCVVPSVYDNSPYTCLEAMSCGKAVVGTSAGGTKEYVVHGQCGLIVPPRDSQALATAITSLLKDGKTRLSMGQAARIRVEEKFQSREIARQTLRVYEQAISHFAQHKSGLYLKPPEQALPDAAVMLYAYDKMLFDLLYRQSIGFRLRHWWRLSLNRPRLFAAKLVLHSLRTAFSLIPGGGAHRRLILWLEHQVSARQEDPLQSISHSAVKLAATQEIDAEQQPAKQIGSPHASAVAAESAAGSYNKDE